MCVALRCLELLWLDSTTMMWGRAMISFTLSEGPRPSEARGWHAPPRAAAASDRRGRDEPDDALRMPASPSQPLEVDHYYH
jgi:hypothetical protein